MRHRIRQALWILIAVCMSAAALQLWAVDPPTAGSLDALAFEHPDLTLTDSAQSVDRLPPQASARAQEALATLGITSQGARVDRRGGRFETLLPSHSLVSERTPPGQSRTQRAEAARNAFRSFLNAHRQELGVDAGELSSGRVTVHGDGSVVQIHMQRLVEGVPVRGSYVSGVVNHGKLALYGTQRWGNVHVSRRPTVSADEALAGAADFLAPHAMSGTRGKAQLLLVPTARSQGPDDVGNGYGHRLVWQLHPTFEGDLGNWELLADAATGEVVSFRDENTYAEVKGGVLPVTNDGIAPDGVEQPGWPMPFMTVSGQVTDTGGNVALTGSMTGSLSGPFVNINDNCGAISLTQNGGLDFGASGGTDCATPGFGGAGNTHASRTGFYELNKIIEMAKGWLPTNTWLQQQLTSNMNINQTCNAFWGGGTVNFYRSGGGCFNTGEIAGVFDHEWGHGIDDNDANPSISSPSGEGIADIYTALRLNTSCIGRNFRATVCTGFGDPCLTCTGVRDIDYLKRASGQPHGFSWSNANCGTSVHCRGGVYSEAVWSLWKRILQSAPYNLDNNTAHEVTNRLTFLGAGAVGTWYAGSPPFGGCGSTGGYLNYLAVDDDNGNLNDGTPHMQAIFDAFNDQEIACATPTVQDSGCAGTPTAAPTVNATPADKSVNLTWNVIAGASSYAVFRTEGVFACDFGKVRLGETTGTSWTDNDLQNGRDYSYVVIPKGTNAACFGSASSCATAAPAAGPNLGVNAGSAALAILTGDGDQFLDNCEDASLTFDVDNTGLGGLTNVRIVSVTPTSHPSTTVTTGFPAAVSPSSIAQGGTGSGSFDFTAGGLAPNDTLTFQVEVTADELGSSRFQDLSVSSTESDFVTFASKTFSFESDLEDWAVAQGTFNRSSALGGGGSTSWAVASSNGLDGQCDRIRSPLLRLQATSTLSLDTNFDIEPQSGGTWYDRANVGVIDSGARTAVSPDGGRTYNANSGGPGNFSGCNEPEPGWAATAATWAGSSWSSTALQSGTFAGQDVQLEVIYSTDGALANRGFSFDQVTVTNVDFQEADGQSDTCSAGCTLDSECTDGLFCNGVETCNAGTCQSGTPVVCDDSVGCTDDACNEATDSCDFVANDGNCANGLFCDGVETCDPVNDCQLGTPVDCDDSVACTADSCNEGTDSCDNAPNDGACDNGVFCDGAETCDPGLGCQPGTPPSCDDGVGCTDDSCNVGTDVCDNVANDANCDNGAFCDGVETCDAGLDCQVGSDPCPGQSCDEGGDVCVPLVCDNDGVCESGEDCGNCAADCPSFPLPAASCGNGLCEAGDGEDCVSCAADCAGVQGGKPSGRFCCGDGDGQTPVSCGDSRCTSGGFSCTSVPQGPGGSTCCGDLVCEGPEDGTSCALDCGAPAVCGDLSCDPGEDQCNCASDCGTPPGSEAGLCTDGTDNDCDLAVDCDDSDCSGVDPACPVCTSSGGACSANGQCCSSKCKGNGTCQ